MSNNDIPFEVICVDDSPGKNYGTIPNFKKGDTVHALQSTEYPESYNVIEHLYNDIGGLQSWFKSRFRRLAKSFTNALTASLAAQVEVGDGVDIIKEPVKIEI